MKPNFLLVSCLCLFPILVFSQYWQKEAQWIYWQQKYMPSMPDGYRLLTKSGDTIIDHKACVIIRENYISMGPNGLDTSKFAYDYIVNSEGNKVFYYEMDTKSFELLYDFDLKAGDTFTSYCTFSRLHFNVRIDSTTKIDISAQQRKVQYLRSFDISSGCRLDWMTIEGIGNFQFLFPRPDFVDPPPGGGLICYRDDRIIYPNVKDCELVIASKEADRNMLNIYPNPVEGLLHIEGIENGDIRIFNTEGISILNPGFSNEIDFSSLPAGLYVLKLKTDRQILTRKIIKLAR